MGSAMPGWNDLNYLNDWNDLNTLCVSDHQTRTIFAL